MLFLTFHYIITEKVGCVTNYEVTLQLRSNANPKYFRERFFSYTSSSRGKEAKRPGISGIISKCNRSD